VGKQQDFRSVRDFGSLRQAIHHDFLLRPERIALVVRVAAAV